MNELQEILVRNTSTIEYDRMKQSLKHLFDYFGMNHMYYVVHFPSGGIAYVGTNVDAFHFFFESCEVFLSCPVISLSKIPSLDPTGLNVGSRNRNEKWDFNLLQNTPSQTYLNFLENAKKFFDINLSLNITRTTSQGIVSYGFGFKENGRYVDELLVNHLASLYRFYDFFVEENKKLLDIICENQVDLSPLNNEYTKKKSVTTLPNTEKKLNLLKQFGLGAIETLTPRELEILKFVSKGYSAYYIGKELFVSVRTVENHIVNIKSKLNVSSKIELINKIQGFYSIIA